MIKLTEYALKRPIVIGSVVLLVLIFGLFSLFQMKRSYLPKMSLPLVTITAEYPGAGAQMMQNLVVDPLETKVRTVPGIKQLFIASYQQLAIIQVQFAFGLTEFQLSQKLNDIKSKVNEAMPALPVQVKPPTVELLTVSATPVTWILFRSKTKDMTNLTSTIEAFRKMLLMQPGVEGAQLFGDSEPVINVKLDQSLMSTYGVTLGMVYHALAKQYSQIPGATVNQGGQQFSLNLNQSFKNVNELNKVIVAYRNTLPIYLKQFAQIELQNQPKSTMVYWGGQPAIAMNLLSNDSNGAIFTLNHTESFMRTHANDLLKEVQYKFFFSQKDLIEDTSGNLILTLFFSFIFTSLIVFLYLARLRATLIVLIAIPISLLATVIVMYLSGLSFNMASLLSLILLAGLVVDDAIVVVENYDYFKSKYPEKMQVEIILLSIQAIMNSVIAYTIALILVFSSVAFMSGIAKIMFQNVVNVVIPGVIFSFLVSIFVTPVLCARFDARAYSSTPFSKKVERILKQGESCYEKFLGYVIQHKKYFAGLLLIFILPAIFVFPRLGANFMPAVNNGRVQANYIINDNYDSNLVRDKILMAFQNLKKYINPDDAFSVSNTAFVNQGSLYIEAPQFQKSGIQQEIDFFQSRFSLVPDMRLIFSPPPVAVGQTPQALQFSIIGQNFSDVYREAYRLEGLLANFPALGNFVLDTPRLLTGYQLSIDNELAAKMGFTPEDIKQMVSLYGGGILAANVYYQGKNYAIKLFPQMNTLTTPADLKKIYAFNTQGQWVKLNALAKLELTQSPAIINSSLQGYSVTFGSSPSVSLSVAMKQVSAILNKALPKNITFEFVGTSVYLKNTLYSTAVALSISLLLLYFLLVFQFNSFVLPWILLLSQLLGACGAVYALFVLGLAVNLYSLIGIFLLIGLVTKNSILVMTLTNSFLAQGKTAEEAIKLACLRRARPILMTSMTIILAMFPVLFIYDPNRVSQISLSVTVMAGMFFSTVLTLIFLPVLYLFVKKGNRK